MLHITIPARELWDERSQRFVQTKEYNLQLEHSLVSISKWESKWKKAFFSKKDKTSEEMIDYIKCMTITQNVKPETYNYLTEDNLTQIKEYIEDPMTAVYFNDSKEKGGHKETVTSDLIYYWMTALNIPLECQKWHLNRLITLIRVSSLKNTPPKKMSRKELMSRNRSINEANKKRFNTRG